MDHDKYIGRMLDNRYEILEVIGTGGMAVVYKARCHRLNRLVAIKILKDDNLGDEDFRRRFHAESQAVAMLSHPNIVSVYDVSTSVMADYIVMELIEGITLKQYMKKKGVLNWKETLHFAMQIAKALEHAHGKGIVHRDIKPHNVMVLKNGSVKVMDFGIARLISKGNTLTKEALGSVHYISPEQAKGGRVDNRSDIYSLGVVMYEMMTGRPPYEGESPVSVAIQHINGGAAMPSVFNPNIPGGLEQIIMRAMAKSVANRYPSATRMLSDMDEFRKDPTMLFDYTGLSVDEAIRMSKPPLVLNPQPGTKPETPARPQTTPRPSTGRKTAPQNHRRRKPRRTQQEIRRNKMTTIAIVSCSVVAILAVGIFMAILLGGGFTPDEKLVTIPKLTGEVFDELPDYAGLTIRKEEAYNDSVEAGIVISQAPVAGEKVVEGSLVVVKVSLGSIPRVVKMTDLTGRSKEWAIDFLDSQDFGLKYTIKEENHDSIAQGQVIRTEPKAGVELTNGQSITLWVSKGKKVQFSAMPDLVNQTEEQARKTLNLQDMALDIVVEEVFNINIKAGTVMETEPTSGERLKTGQTVKLYVSKGVEKKAMPDLVGMEHTQASELLTTMGFKPPKITYEFSTEPENTVIGQSHEKGVEYEVHEDIVLRVSKGPSGEMEITKDVVIDLKNAALEDKRDVSVFRNGKIVHFESVAKGTQSITIEDQVGTGTVKYTVHINGEYAWDVSEVFTKQTS
ncbi:MAG: Stk1 family PASTA domain-containing Ser/Thr kinase [Oscillospiraceae bacterium]|nr:Stk1 family PASTA domain-containing Ser/Thr kinase [Oscillospiraceae bacterium]